jgi:hypothetical protein
MNIVRRTERMLNIAYVIWVASIAAIVATSSMLLFNATYFAFLVFFPSIAFGLRKRYALATFIFFLMLRGFIFFFSTTSPMYVFYLFYITLTLLFEEIFTRRTLFDKTTLRATLFILFVATYDILVANAYEYEIVVFSYDFGNVYNMVKTWVINALLVVVTYRISLTAVFDEVSERINFLSIILAQISYLVFYAAKIGQHARVAVVSEVLNIDLTSYTRIDPNFYVSLVVLLTLLFIPRKKLYQLLSIILLLAFNVLYLLSITGFALIMFALFFIIVSSVKRRFRPLVFIALLVVGILGLNYVIASKYGDLNISNIFGNAGVSKYDFINRLLTRRPEIWVGYFQLIMDHPLGVGIQNAWLHVYKYIGEAIFPHNIFIDLIAGLGIGLGGFVITALLYILVKLLAKGKMLTSATTAYAAMLIAGLTLSVISWHMTYITIGAVLRYLSLYKLGQCKLQSMS